MGVREGKIVEPRKVEDLKPGDLVQHYSTWEQTWGDPIRREVVKVEFGPNVREHDYVVTWRDPRDADAEPYDTREKQGKVVDLIVGDSPPEPTREELAEARLMRAATALARFVFLGYCVPRADMARAALAAADDAGEDWMDRLPPKRIAQGDGAPLSDHQHTAGEPGER